MFLLFFGVGVCGGSRYGRDWWNVLRYRWRNCVKGFDLPPPVAVDGKTLRVGRNFYVNVSSVPAF